MSAETLIQAALIGDAGLTAVVPLANIAADSVQGLPAVVTNRAGTEYTNTIHGSVPVASDATMDSNCMAATRLAAENVGDLVVTALATAGFLVIDRRQDFDPETLTYITVVTCRISL